MALIGHTPTRRPSVLDALKVPLQADTIFRCGYSLCGYIGCHDCHPPTRRDLVPACKWVGGCVDPLRCMGKTGCLGLDPIERRHTVPATPETPKEPMTTTDTPKPANALPDDDKARLEYPLFDGFLAYFPNAAAEVSKLSYAATQQHHPDQPMHWDRSKSTDHGNKIIRHQLDAGGFDGKGHRHSTMVAWRAMAQLQEELERDLGLPPSRASKNRPW